MQKTSAWKPDRKPGTCDGCDKYAELTKVSSGLHATWWCEQCYREIKDSQ